MYTKANREYWQDIWEKFKAGDRFAFETIYNEFVNVLYAYGSKITSNKDLLEDSIQDLFIDVYRYGSTLRHPDYLEFYLFKTLKRIIIRKLKENHRIDLKGDSFERFDLKFSMEDINEKEMLEKNIKLMKSEIQNLDDKKRELIFLKFYSGLTYTEIGEMLNMKPDTVKKQVRRLLKQIQNKMGNEMFGFFLLSVKHVK